MRNVLVYVCSVWFGLDWLGLAREGLEYWRLGSVFVGSVLLGLAWFGLKLALALDRFAGLCLALPGGRS
jgi:hypothetical protein